jgi:hypothetical protein
MQIDGEGIENFLMNTVLEKFQHQKKTNLKNTPFHASLFGNGLNGF